MNNLVSRNPVLRFKLGRKIIFAKWGDKAEDPTPIKFSRTNEYYFGEWTGGDIIDGTKLIRDTELVRKKDETYPFYESFLFYETPYSKIATDNDLVRIYLSVPLDVINSYYATNSKPVIDNKHLQKKKVNKL